MKYSIQRPLCLTLLLLLQTPTTILGFAYYRHINFGGNSVRKMRRFRVSHVGKRERIPLVVVRLGESSSSSEDSTASSGKIRKGVSSLVSRVVRRHNENGKQHLLPPPSTGSTEYAVLKQENDILRRTIHQLEQENEALQKTSGKIVIETFEGEGRGFGRKEDSVWYYENEDEIMDGLTMTEQEMASGNKNELWCDELDGDACPVEPDVSFLDALRDRAYWLVGLLALQSCSGIILSHNEALLQNHPIIIYFLTMLVGAGGNAGNQASVRVIRGLALGTLNDQTQQQFLQREFKMALSLSTVLSLAGFLRAAAFKTPLAETVAVTGALCMIVFSSICLGAVLPLVLKRLGVDPAHSSTTIQVIMDILGVVLTVLVSSAILDSPIGQLITAKLSGS